VEICDARGNSGQVVPDMIQFGNDRSGGLVGEPRLGARCAPLLFALVLAAPALAQVSTPAAKFVGSPEEATARQLAQQRGPDETYRFLAPLEGRYAGDADYDYALGTVALDSGRQSHAVFVLQRSVAARPGFAGARMELARAYFALGDNESARREFAILEKDNPPPQAQRAIDEYLAAIDRRAAAYRRQRSAYAELGSGYDSNANGAPDIQNFLGIQLDSRNQATASGYYALGVGGLVSQPFAPGWRLIGTGNAAYRANPDASFVDSQVLRLAGGVDWRAGGFELSLQPNFGAVLLDGEDNHQVTGIDLGGTWHRERAQWSVNARASQTRHADGLEILDVDTLIAGLALQYAPTSAPRARLMAVVTFGTDDAVEPGAPYGRDLFGGRLGVTFDLSGVHSVLASIASVSSSYDGTFPGIRDDDQLGAMLGYEWGGWRARGWTVRTQLNYVDNRSTVALYDYDRIDAGLSVRKEFR
jgi:tetratricopeptide (TPR) repeat protein